METGNELLRLEDLTPDELAIFINGLIEKDFSRLVQILYRLDVSEDKLKTVLQENPTGDAGNMIAILIIERIAQREQVKEMFKPQGKIPEDEKW
jgi:hypothetical protein